MAWPGLATRDDLLGWPSIVAAGEFPRLKWRLVWENGTGCSPALHYGKPTEGVWSLLKRSIANFAAADQARPGPHHQAQLKKIQYRPHLINGCLGATGLRIEPW